MVLKNVNADLKCEWFLKANSSTLMSSIICFRIVLLYPLNLIERDYSSKPKCCSQAFEKFAWKQFYCFVKTWKVLYGWSNLEKKMQFWFHTYTIPFRKIYLLCFFLGIGFIDLTKANPMRLDPHLPRNLPEYFSHHFSGKKTFVAVHQYTRYIYGTGGSYNSQVAQKNLLKKN